MSYFPPTEPVPQELPFELVLEGDRAREVYEGIEELAEDITELGLIEPIILVRVFDPTVGTFYQLNAGGRRYRALKHLGVTTLYHGTTCEPGKPGFLLKGEAQSTPLKNKLTEIAENLNRMNLRWNEEMKLIVQAYQIARVEKNAAGEQLVMRQFGNTLGVSYAKLQAAVVIYDDFKENPDRYKEVTSIRGAYAKLLNENARALAEEAARRMKSGPAKMTIPAIVDGEVTSIEIVGEIGEASPTKPQIDLSPFRLGDSLTHLSSFADNYFDHIVTDPDYAVAVDRLTANSEAQAAGVAQESVEQSLNELRVFLKHAYRITKPSAFLVFFYDLDHHEKAQTWAKEAGWLVQRWPLIWEKVDYFSNASAQHNFTKNIEYAMICRKPGAVLTEVQKSSVFHGPTGSVTKDFNHPFAKPLPLWKFIYKAIATPGQKVLDPFMGSGTGPAAAVEFGLQAHGIEVNSDHYNNALLNLKRTFTKMHGECDFI